MLVPNIVTPEHCSLNFSPQAIAAARLFCASATSKWAEEIRMATERSDVIAAMETQWTVLCIILILRKMQHRPALANAQGTSEKTPDAG